MRNLTLLLIMACAAQAKAETTNPWFEQVRRWGHYSSLEGAGSNGSMGIAIGLGAERIKPDRPSGILSDQSYGIANEVPASQLTKVWVGGGTPYPVNWGLAYGRAEDGTVTTLGGHLQAVLFEEHALPAVATRLSYSTVLGLKSTEARLTSGEAVASYGYGFVSVHAYAGATLARIAIDIAPSERTKLYLTDAETEETFAANILKRSSGYGIKIKPTAMSAIVIETRFNGRTQESIAAKWSVGL